MGTSCVHSLTVRGQSVQILGLKSELYALQVLPDPPPTDHCLLVNRPLDFMGFWIEHDGRIIWGEGVTDDQKTLVSEAIGMLVEKGELNEYYRCFCDD